MRQATILWLALALAPAVAEAQAKKPAAPQGHPGVDPKKVDAAIERGVQWLIANKPVVPVDDGGKAKAPRNRGVEIDKECTHELVLFTLFHAGVRPPHATFEGLLREMLDVDPNWTYRTSLQAMLLSEFDPTKYQERIARCAQFLVDNQCSNGQWTYGEPTAYPAWVATPSTAKPVATRSGSSRNAPKPAGPPKPRTEIRVKRQRGGPDAGDNSNSQYAALGIRACLEANVIPPAETLVLARKWWEETQEGDGGWIYGKAGRGPTGSMTAGGLGSLVIFKHCLKEPWAADAKVLKATQWITDHFSVTENPENLKHYFYYLYALERAGVFTQRSTFGAHDWYREGANQLLGIQDASGSWGGGVVDTCFAILFLRRATMPLTDVPSVDRMNRLK